MYIDPQQFSSIAGMPVHRMGDGQGYEFIYIAQCETKICQKSPGIGGLGRLRGANLAPKGPLPTLRPELKTADR